MYSFSPMKNIFSTFIFLVFMSYSQLALAQDEGSLAPDFSLSLQGGGDFTLSDHSGKVVFMFIFGYGCHYCMANGSFTESDIFQEFKNNPNFVALGIDAWDGNETAVENFRGLSRITYPLAMQGSKMVERYATTYDRIIIVDAEGVIQYKGTTNAYSGIVELAHDIIDDLLKSINRSETVLNVEDQVTFEVYPNPTVRDITVKSEFIRQLESTVSIFSLSGKTLYTSGFSKDASGRIAFNIPRNIKGTNLLKLTFSDGREFSQRLIIK